MKAKNKHRCFDISIIYDIISGSDEAKNVSKVKEYH